MAIQTDVLIIGGGFAGATVAQALEKKGIKTTLIDKKDYFEVTFATLRDIAAPEKTKNSARKKYHDFLTGEFIQGEVVALTAQVVRLSDGRDIAFKQCVIASGTRYSSLPVAKSNSALDIGARNEELLSAHHTLKSANKVLVIGGGIVGVELAGEIAYAMPNISVSLAHNSDSLLNGFKEKAQIRSAQQLQELGVEILFNSAYQKVNGKYIDQDTGAENDADVVFEATGVVPNNEYLKANLSHTLNDYGYVRVNEKLEVIGENNLYALGDIAEVGEPKLGYLAQNQGSYLAKLIAKKYRRKSSKAYKRNPLIALIPVGQKEGVVQLPFAVTTLRFMIGMKQKDLFINKVYKAFGTKPNSHKV